VGSYFLFGALITSSKICDKDKGNLGKSKSDIGKSTREDNIYIYINKKRVEVDKYKVEDLVMLSTKDLKYQMVRRRIEKLMEKFVGPYRTKKIILLNTVELELLSTIKMHPVVNVSRIHRYIGKVEGQRKKQLALVIIEEEEE